MNIRKWVKQYPSSLVIGTVPFPSIIEKYKTEYGAADIPAMEIPNLRMHRFNAVHLPSNDTLGLREDMLDVKAIRIPITDCSKHFTLKDFVSQNTRSSTGDDFIYLAYEEQVGYHYSNSNKLFLEVALARGIDAVHVKQETEEYVCYLFYLQCYLQHLSSEGNRKPDSSIGKIPQNTEMGL